MSSGDMCVAAHARRRRLPEADLPRIPAQTGEAPKSAGPYSDAVRISRIVRS